MRVFLLIAGAGLAFVAAQSSAQTSDPNVGACVQKSGDEAIAACTEAITSGKLNDLALALILRGRGNAYYAENDFVHAVADYSESIRLNPQDADGFYNRGVAYDAEKDFAHAIADYTEAIRLNPQNVRAFNNRGSAYRQEGDFAHAVSDFSEAILLDSNFATALYGRSLAEAHLGKMVESKADMARALAIDPNIGN
jgi:tetratricopeptide (TPR) repeat protein